MSDTPNEPTIDFACIGRTLQPLTGEVASLRDDMHVLAAIVQRLDNSQRRMIEEVRASSSQPQHRSPGFRRDCERGLR